MSAVIETHQLSKVYGRTHALDGLDLRVEAGQVHGFWARTAPENPRRFGCCWA